MAVKLKRVQTLRSYHTTCPTQVIQEEKKQYTKHDQLFKELIHTFFGEFLEAFFPEIYDQIEFQSITPLSEEVHTNLIEGSTRRLDIVAALLSKMGYTKKERIEVKKEFLRMIARMELNPAKQRLIYGFFESYLKLNEVEEEKLMEEIRKLDDAEKILELPISYEEKGKEEGIKEVALAMLKEDIDINLIAKVTHLEKGEIEELAKTL